MYVGARGGNFIHANESAVIFRTSPAIEEMTQDFARQGFTENNPRIGRLLNRAAHPGFVTDRDIFTAEEMESEPVYRDFLTPLGADAGAATLIQGSAHDAMVFTMRFFPIMRLRRTLFPSSTSYAPISLDQ